MHFTLFENLEFKRGEQMYIVDEKGEGLHGQYLGQYDRGSGTFLFKNSGTGQDETMVVANMQRIEKR